MSQFTLPYHLLIPTVVSLVSLIILLLKRRILRRKNYVFYKSAIIFFSAYLLIVGNALGHDLYYQWDLNRYDLDQDGIFGNPTETTPEQELALQRLINDTGRNFSFISGFIVSAALSISVCILMKVNHILFGQVDTDKTNILNKIHTD